MKRQRDTFDDCMWWVLAILFALICLGPIVLTFGWMAQGCGDAILRAMGFPK